MTHLRNIQPACLSCDLGHVKCQAVTTAVGGTRAGRQPVRQHGAQALSKALTFWGRECEILADICVRGVCMRVSLWMCACEDSCVKRRPGSNDEEHRVRRYIRIHSCCLKYVTVIHLYWKSFMVVGFTVAPP